MPAQPLPAIGDGAPVWPLPGVDPRGKPTHGGSFGVDRGDHYHAGVDLGAPAGSLVIAMEPGKIVRIRRAWAGGDTGRMLIEGDSGLVINYGAIKPDSWEEWGLGVGDRVEKGEVIARVGTYPRGSSMLHLETYVPGTRDNIRWNMGEPAPPELLNPTWYLDRAKASEGVAPTPAPTPPPPVQPAPGPGPVVAGVGMGAVGLLLVAAVLLIGQQNR